MLTNQKLALSWHTVSILYPIRSVRLVERLKRQTHTLFTLNLKFQFSASAGYNQAKEKMEKAETTSIYSEVTH